MMESKVFISYSRKDLSEVKGIIAQIDDSLSIKCWIDLKGIESSAEFRNVVIKAIDDCEIVLFMVSPNSIESKNVEKEIMYAYKKEKRIVMICLNDSRPDGWVVFEFPRVDYIRATNEDQMQKLIHDMEGWLGIQAIGPVLKELSKLYEDWEKLEHEQAGILQHVIEKERSIGNRDISTSEKIKSQSVSQDQHNKLLQEIERLKKENDELKKEVKELHVHKEQNISLNDEKRRLIDETEALKSKNGNTRTISTSDTPSSLTDVAFSLFSSFMGNSGSSIPIAITPNSRHSILGSYVCFYQLDNFYYCWLPKLLSKDEWMRFNKKDFEEKKKCILDIPTVKELKEVLAKGSHNPHSAVYWVKNEGRIMAYSPIKDSVSMNDKATFVGIAKSK